MLTFDTVLVLLWSGIALAPIYMRQGKVMADEPNSLKADEFDFDDFELDDLITDQVTHILLLGLKNSGSDRLVKFLCPCRFLR